MTSPDLSAKSRVQIDRMKIAEWVKNHPGVAVSAELLDVELQVDRQTANYWLRDRQRSNRPADPFYRRIHKIGWGSYVYFKDAIPIDWKDRINDYEAKRALTSPKAERRVEAPPHPSSGLCFEMLRHNPETNRVLLHDENGDVWTGSLVRVDV